MSQEIRAISRVKTEVEKKLMSAGIQKPDIVVIQ